MPERGTAKEWRGVCAAGRLMGGPKSEVISGEDVVVEDPCIDDA